MTIKTRDPNFNVAFRRIASFRCDATVRRLSGTKRTRVVSWIDFAQIRKVLGWALAQSHPTKAQ
jgi:hypothetical protein